MQVKKELTLAAVLDTRAEFFHASIKEIVSAPFTIKNSFSWRYHVIRTSVTWQN